jgi:sirohydrochlorin cobaltochelatase
MVKTLKTLLSVLVVAALAACATSGSGEWSGKPVILVVSFGTSFNDSREKTIGAIENSIADAYPDYEVRRAWTSQIVIDKLKKRDGITIDNIGDAMKRLKKEGVRDVVIQPTHIMEGFEYDDVIKEVKPYQNNFASIKYGLPVLVSDNDYNDLINVITTETSQYNTGDTAVVFMGHGTEHASNSVYAKLNIMLKEKKFPRYLVGTVEAKPSLDDIIVELAKLNAKRVVLEPLMIVAGDHANNDMAGDEDDSWKTILESKGYSTVPVLKGLGEFAGVQQIFVRHVANAIGS